MVLAAGVHAMHGEPPIIPNVVLGALAAFVAWGTVQESPHLASLNRKPMLEIAIITGSTRLSRHNEAVSRWVLDPCQAAARR